MNGDSGSPCQLHMFGTLISMGFANKNPEVQFVCFSRLESEGIQKGLLQVSHSNQELREKVLWCQQDNEFCLIYIYNLEYIYMGSYYPGYVGILSHYNDPH